MEGYESVLKNVSDPAVSAVVCTFLMLYMASTAGESHLIKSELLQFTVVGAISALSAVRNPVISIVLLMAFYCLSV